MVICIKYVDGYRYGCMREQHSAACSYTHTQTMYLNIIGLISVSDLKKYYRRKIFTLTRSTLML